jgi:hypothetical protein
MREGEGERKKITILLTVLSPPLLQSNCRYRLAHYPVAQALGFSIELICIDGSV